MSYSTGSGNYDDLMDAVLAHAIADGWTATSGDWPISKGDVRGIDWSTYTTTEQDRTGGGPGGPRTQRYIRIGIGTSGANATTDAGTSTVVVPNMGYAITGWYIFSEPDVCDYIHVVFQFSNGLNSDCFGHFSFGEIDKGGFTHGGVMYATSRLCLGYAVDATAGFNGASWNTLHRGGQIFAGQVGAGDSASTQLSILINGTDAPSPDGSGGWPAHDAVIRNGDKVWGKTGRISYNSILNYDGASADCSLDFIAWTAIDQLYSGAVTLCPLQMYLINAVTSGARLRFVGNFPNVRKCSMFNFAPLTEVVYGGETWVMFPLLRKTSDSLLGAAFTVTTGAAGLAYKKVI